MVQQLFCQAGDCADYMACSIWIHNYAKFFERPKDKWLKLCLHRDLIIQIRLESTLVRAIRASPNMLTAGLRLVWSEADPYQDFTPNQRVNDRWYVAERSHSRMLMHYNIATGSLLVNSKPLSALPEQYMSDKLYSQILDDRLLDVVAADDPAMEYMTLNLIDGHQVYFGLDGKKSELKIYTTKDGYHYVAIPRTKFQNDIPEGLTGQSNPWLCVETSVVEFRNTKYPWISAKSDWQLSPVSSQQRLYQMESKDHYLMDNCRGVGETICGMLSPLDLSKHIHVLYKKTTKKLVTRLPRYDLHFVVDQNSQLRCNELAAFVPQSQKLGTFHGLRNRLVLQDKESKTSRPKIWVIVPYGTLKVQMTDVHVNVDVDIARTGKINFYKYAVNNTLGCLVADQIEGHLWKAYLHACTTSCLPDELTGCAGIEESFRALNDQLLRTCEPLSQSARDILQCIAELSPARSYYPGTFARHMQTSIWNPGLPFMTQHDKFFEKASTIADHNRKSELLHTDTKFLDLAEKMKRREPELAERAIYFWRKHWAIDSTPGEDPTYGDIMYDSRDKPEPEEMDAVFDVASLIQAWRLSEWAPYDFYALLRRLQTANKKNDPPVVLNFSKSFKPTSLTQLLTVDLKASWPSLFRYCLEIEESDKAELLYVMSMIVYGQPNHVEDIRVILAFAFLPALKAVNLPSQADLAFTFETSVDWDRYDLSLGNEIDWKVIEDIIKACEIKSLEPTRHLQRQYDGPPDDDNVAELQLRVQRRSIRKAVEAAQLERSLQLPDDDNLSRFDVASLRVMLEGRRMTWKKNQLLLKKCKEWQNVLNVLEVRSEQLLSCPNIWLPSSSCYSVPRLKDGYHSLLTLMGKIDTIGGVTRSIEATKFDRSIMSEFVQDHHKESDFQLEHQALSEELDLIIAAKVGKQDKTSQQYAKALSNSNAALKEVRHESKGSFKFPNQAVLADKFRQINKSTDDIVELVNERLKPVSQGQKALQLAGLWPKATTPDLLQLISKSHRQGLSSGWLDILVQFACELCSLQRIERIIRFFEAKDHFKFRKEVENNAHEYWEPKHDLDWLLFEVQNNILIRPVQVDVARRLINPKEGENGVLQLQMGDGKSSVILPLFCMSVAANKDRLVRVIVLKALEKETLNNLSKALSGFVQTPLYWLPFSRSTPVTRDTASKVRKLWKECRLSSGVLLALPEYLNSFRLIGNDQLTAGRLETAKQLLAAQKYLDNMTRDIIDESDAILSPTYELVYTNGDPRILSGAPLRWNVLFSVLDVVQTCAANVHSKFPDGIEYEKHEPGTFATIRILTTEAKEALTDATLASIFAGDLPSLSFHHLDVDTVQMVSAFIRSVKVKGVTHQTVKKHFEVAEQLFVIHLLRGLFAWGFLAAAFEKRFFVNYGLDRTRCMTAIPFRAKGVAAAAAEFAQPEMMVLLSALSYCYTGLALSDMRQALSAMLRLPDPSDEYTRWIYGSAAPDVIRSVGSINLQDEECIAMIHKHLHKRKTVVDFFLRTVALPRESKEYLFKLSSSAWDLCATDNGRIVGGFSGTTDSLIPEFMKSIELPGLMHFDAAVLQSLLQSRNRRYVRAAHDNGTSMQTEALLSLIEAEVPDTSIIIDVGAQTLDRNEDIAKMWLHIRHKSRNPNIKSAAVFFNENDEKLVVTLDGNIQPWASSPYKEQVHNCLIYLDQHHTRGVDLQLPDKFAAALLLGPRLPKDAFVQAAMRLRKLAESQRLVTFAPPEVDNDIRMSLSKVPDDTLDVADVIRWVIRQSCDVLRSQETLRVMRHLEWLKRSRAFRDQILADGTVKNRPLYIENIRQPEVNNVQDLYGASVNSLLRVPKFSKHELKDKEIQRYLQRKTDVVDVQEYLEGSKDKEQEQEQEREQQHEREAEREVERPRQANAKDPDVNQGLGAIIMQDSPSRMLPTGLCPAFSLLRRTSLYTDPLWRRFPAILLATKGHIETVKSSTNLDQDDFVRPVHWIIKLENIRELILISPHEAQTWMPYLRRCSNATLITYAPKTSREMMSFDKLDMYTVPQRSEPVQVDADVLTLLRLFAGQLYFNNFEEYERFCVLLSIRCAAEPLVEGEKWGERRTAMLRLSKKKVKKFEFAPLVKRWIDIRRRGVEWGFTDVGRVLNGEILHVRHFQ